MVDDNVVILVKQKQRLWKSWKQSGSKDDYLETKRTARRAVYDAKRAAKLKRFGNVLRGEDDRAQVFKIAKQMTTINQDIVGDKCIRNDRGDLATCDYGKHLTWQEHYQRLPNEEFEWNKVYSNVNDPIIGPHLQIDEESVRKALHKMKKDKASTTSGIVSGMLLASGDVGIEQMTNHFNKITSEYKPPEDWDTSVIVNQGLLNWL